MAKILIIEDELSIQNILKNFLLNEGHDVYTSGDGVEGINAFKAYNLDLILLDIMLPKVDGYGVCEIIRAESQVPIIMLTALDNERSQVKGFDLMIDDYITKPFSTDVLIRRVNAVLRRSSHNKDNGNEQMIIYKNLKMDILSYELFIDDTKIDVTAREFEILKLLLENQGRVYSREQLLDIIWNYEYLGETKVINTHIKNIRKKIGDNYIQTIRGVGYKVDREN